MFCENCFFIVKTKTLCFCSQMYKYQKLQSRWLGVKILFVLVSEESICLFSLVDITVLKVFHLLVSIYNLNVISIFKIYIIEPFVQENQLHLSCVQLERMKQHFREMQILSFLIVQEILHIITRLLGVKLLLLQVCLCIVYFKVLLQLKLKSNILLILQCQFRSILFLK